MLKCFIACSFGKKDVDYIYNKALLSVLKDKGIKALRVDRIEHNENIDSKIINLIRESDFSISDLTYARPSVYYEAGYSMGMGHPVIFTVRKDHFLPKEEDEYGNMRVHFDLQMKNIIDWPRTNKISKFKKRLVKRLDLICKPLWEMEKKNNEIAEFKKNFLMLSVTKRLSEIRKKVQDELFKDKWRPKYRSQYNEDRNIVEYFIKGKRIIQPIYLDSATKNEMKYLLRTSMEEYRELIDKGYEYHFFVIALRKIPITRLESTFRFAIIIEYGKILKERVYRGNSYYMNFIAGLGYVDEYVAEFKNHLQYKYAKTTE